MTVLDNRVPYVKNTFLCLDPPKETDGARRRAMSVSPKGSCDTFARQLHALLYRPTPVRAQPRRATPPEEIEVVASIEVTLPWVSTTPRNDAKKHTNTNSPIKGKKDFVSGYPLESGEETPSTQIGSDSDAGPPSSPPVASIPEDYDYYASLTDEELLLLVPRNEAGAVLSIGSTGHEEGTCRPCVFAYNENKQCQGGIRCTFCHYQHPPKKRVRLCKKKRMELRKQQEQDDYDEEY